MNFCDVKVGQFRKQGLSENEIYDKMSRYFLYSKVFLIVYIFVTVLLVILNRLKTTDISALILFFILFAAILQMFLMFRKWMKVNKKV